MMVYNQKFKVANTNRRLPSLLLQPVGGEQDGAAAAGNKNGNTERNTNANTNANRNRNKNMYKLEV